jgi:hypothetical protein
MQSKIRIFEGHSPAFFIIAAFKSTIVHYYKILNGPVIEFPKSLIFELYLNFSQNRHNLHNGLKYIKKKTRIYVKELDIVYLQLELELFQQKM